MWGSVPVGGLPLPLFTGAAFFTFTDIDQEMINV
jgi:hypothetical protein